MSHRGVPAGIRAWLTRKCFQASAVLDRLTLVSLSVSMQANLGELG